MILLPSPRFKTAVFRPAPQKAPGFYLHQVSLCRIVLLSKETVIMKLYLAAARFNQAQRIWNRFVAEALATLGHDVILPQDTLKECTTNGVVDFMLLDTKLHHDAGEADAMVVVFDNRMYVASEIVAELILRSSHLRTFHRPTNIVAVVTDQRKFPDDEIAGILRRTDVRIDYATIPDEDITTLCVAIDKAIRQFKTPA